MAGITTDYEDVYSVIPDMASVYVTPRNLEAVESSYLTPADVSVQSPEYLSLTEFRQTETDDVTARETGGRPGVEDVTRHSACSGMRVSPLSGCVIVLAIFLLVISGAVCYLLYANIMTGKLHLITHTYN